MRLLILTLLPALLLTLFLSAHCPAQHGPKALTKEEALQAITIFCDSPLSEEGKTAAAQIVQFAEKSPDIEINLDRKFVPWFTEEPQPQHAALLLAAYIVGNTKSQLESGKTKNDSLAGVLQAIATYRQIQKQEPDLKMADLEKLIELNNQKKLKQYLEGP